MDFIDLDQKYVWHPFTQVQNNPLPLNIVRAEGSWLIAADQTRYLDGIASWWVNAHGHANGYIAEQIADQAKTLEQVIFAGFTHPPAIRLAERLISLMPGNQQRIFYSDNGSTSVEVALKMAIQFFFNQGKHRNRILAFRNGYHGDTLGGMSVAERNAFNLPFEPFLFHVDFLMPPEPGYEEESVRQLRKLLSVHQDIAAFIFEPLVQGASGMRMHCPETLSELIKICREHEIITIADEVFTGFYRTGKMFASEHLENKPDILCLSKALTGGFLPLGATAVPEFIFDSFVSADKRKTFFHGHSYTANPIACRAALASLDLFSQSECIENINSICQAQKAYFSRIKSSSKIQDIRVLGTILAIELKSKEESGYLNPLGDEITQWFLEKNVYLRPLGNVLYCTPPYSMSPEELKMIHDAISAYLEN